MHVQANIRPEDLLNFWALCIDVLLYEESKTLKMDKAQEVDCATLPTTVQIRKVNYS